MKKIRNPKPVCRPALPNRGEQAMSEIYLPTGKVINLKLFIYFAILIFNFAFITSAFASGGEGGGHGLTWKDWLWPVINFSVLVIVLVKFARKPISDFFNKRTETIEKSLKEAQEAKELAQKTLEETKERLKNAEQEINNILEAAKKSGEKDKEALIAEGEKLKNKILEQAKTNIEFELQKARESIKSEASLMALELAEKQIKESIGRKEHETLIDEYIKKLEVNN